MTGLDITEEFVSKYTQLEAHGFEGPDEVHDELERLGKQILKQGFNFVKKPASAGYETWDNIKFYLTDLSQADRRGDTLMILGFLPVMLMVHEGELDNFKYNYEYKDALESVVASSFLDPVAERLENLKVAKFLITHEQLSSANPDNVFELFNLVDSDKGPSEYWTQLDMTVKQDRVSMFYLPFMVYMANDVPDDFHFSDIFSDGMIELISVQNLDLLWNYVNPQGEEFNASIQYGMPEPLREVVQDGATDRDFADIEMSLNRIRENSEQFEDGLSVKLVIEVYWPVPPGHTLPRDVIPTIRLNIAAKPADGSGEVETDIINIHVPQFKGGEWQFVLSRALSLCYEMGYTHVTVIQNSSKHLIQAWQNVNEGFEIH